MSSNATLDAAPGPDWVGYDMAPIFGPFYWGSIISFLLAGITILQAWNYFPGRDRLFVRAVAGVMIVLDVTSTFLTAEGMYRYVIPNYGSLLPLSSLNHFLAAECYLAVIIAFISQAYWAWQIYAVLSTGKQAKLSYVVSGIVFLFAVVALVSGICCASFMIIDDGHVLTGRSYRFAVAVGISKGAASLADIIATISLCYYLSGAKSGFRSTDNMVQKLMTYIVQRGILVTTVQITFMILFFMSTVRLNWLALHVNMTKVYANTFFAMLNGRASLRKTGGSNSSSTNGGMYFGTEGLNSSHGTHSTKTPTIPTFRTSKIYIEKDMVISSEM